MQALSQRREPISVRPALASRRCPGRSECRESVNSDAIPANVVTPVARISSTIGRRLSALSRAAAACTALPWARSASDSVRPRLPPSAMPRALAACSAARVRCEIIAASCSATAAKMCSVNLVALGLSAATIATSPSSSLARNATFRLSRSSFAISSVARRRRHSARLRPTAGAGNCVLTRLR